MNDAPTIEEAKSRAFADLARIVRAQLSAGFASHETEVSEERVRAWIEILESKIPRPPEKPQPIKLPEPPGIPDEPVVEEPLHSPSPRYEALRLHYAGLIAALTAQMNGLGRKKKKPIKKRIGELKGEQQKALFEAKRSDLPKETANRWLTQRAEHEKWQALKQKLFEEHAARVTDTERQNSARRTNWSGQIEAWQKSNDLPLRIVHNLRRDCDAVAHRPEPLAVARLPWRFLPASETGEERVLSALHDFHRRRPEIRVDESRVRYAYSLKPEQIFVGEDEFDGYIAFVFARGVKVLLENPIEGNAAYIFGQDWRLLSKLSKSELLVHHREHLVRVIHSPGWKSDIRQALRRFAG